jgi:hypothetical protein
MIETVLGDHAFHDRASQLSQLLKADNDCVGAVAFLETFIK